MYIYIYSCTYACIHIYIYVKSDNVNCKTHNCSVYMRMYIPIYTCMYVLVC